MKKKKKATPKNVLIVLAAGVLMLLAVSVGRQLLSGSKLSENERRDAEAAVRGVMVQGPAHGKAMVAALRKALASQGPGDEPCPHELEKPAADGSPPVTIVLDGMAVATGTPDALPEAEQLDPRYRLAKRVQGDLWRKFSSAYLLDHLRVQISQLHTNTVLEKERLQLVLVYATRVEATVANANTFEPGYVVGRAFLFERGPLRLACAADVMVTSSDQLETFVTGDGKTSSPRDPQRLFNDNSEWGQITWQLRGDLNSQIAIAIQHELRAAAPQEMSLEDLVLLHEFGPIVLDPE